MKLILDDGNIYVLVEKEQSFLFNCVDGIPHQYDCKVGVAMAYIDRLSFKFNCVFRTLQHTGAAGNAFFRVVKIDHTLFVIWCPTTHRANGVQQPTGQTL